MNLKGLLLPPPTHTPQHTRAHTYILNGQREQSGEVKRGGYTSEQGNAGPFDRLVWKLKMPEVALKREWRFTGMAPRPEYVCDGESMQ